MTQLGRCYRKESVASKYGHQVVRRCRYNIQGNVKAGRCCRHGGEPGRMVYYAGSVTGMSI